MKVNEIFGPTIQGEGKSLGKPVSFIRLAGCNLHCVWCDTPYAWDFRNWDREKESRDITVANVITRVFMLGGPKAIVISGGEPLIQQEELTQLISGLKKWGFWVEIETNGTIFVSDELASLVDQFNCSPKLLNSGNEERGIVVESLTRMASLEQSTFKFVIDSEKDVNEIEQLVLRFQMKQVYLMPLGKTLEELKAREILVRNICGERNWNFTPRRHIELYGSRRGV